MALSADTPRNYARLGDEASLPMQASTTVYAGSALTIDSGGEVGPVTAGDTGFVGFCLKQATNGSTAGETKCRVVTEGIIELAVTGINDNDDHGDIVYASDDGTFTLTSSSTFFKIGKVFQVDDTSSTTCLVKFTSLHDEHWND